MLIAAIKVEHIALPQKARPELTKELSRKDTRPKEKTHEIHRWLLEYAPGNHPLLRL
jgi:hypothetical protein